MLSLHNDGHGCLMVVNDNFYTMYVSFCGIR